MTRTALVVDDSPSFRTLISLTLRQHGFEVTEASDGLEAAGLVESRAFKLIICDLYMPKLDGFGLARRVRASTHNRITPFLMLTTESETSKKAVGRKEGVSAWLSKPFQPSKLMVAVNIMCPA